MAIEKSTRSSPVVGLLARVVLGGAALMPIGAIPALGSLLGGLMWRLPNKLCRVSRLNLDLCLPELATEVRARLLRLSLIETCRGALELGAIWTWPPDRLRALETEVSGGEHLDQARDSGNGVLILLPHVGNWEFINHFISHRGDFTALYRQPRVVELDGLIRRARERTRCTMAAATRSGVRRLYTDLGRGSVVVVLPDQEPVKKSGAFAPFFGIPALTMTLVPRLLRKTGATALMCFAERVAGRGFRVHLRPAPEGLAEGTMEESLTLLNGAVESCVRAHPEQYLWSYKRFKTRPEGEPTPYLGRSYLAANSDRVDQVIRARLLGE